MCQFQKFNAAQRIPLFLASISSTMEKLSESSPITPLAFTYVLWFIIYINVEILYDSTTGFHKPTTNYLLNTTAQTVQPTCNQRSANDAINDAIAKRNFPKFRLQSTNSLFKLNQITEPLDHQRLKGIKFTNISIYSVLATCK